jgi:hypothetical protein
LALDEHFSRHSAWEERDKKFFEEICNDNLQMVCKFLNKYNKYLFKNIAEIDY